MSLRVFDCDRGRDRACVMLPVFLPPLLLGVRVRVG